MSENAPLIVMAACLVVVLAIAASLALSHRSRNAYDPVYLKARYSGYSRAQANAVADHVRRVRREQEGKDADADAIAAFLSEDDRQGVR